MSELDPELLMTTRTSDSLKDVNDQKDAKDFPGGPVVRTPGEEGVPVTDFSDEGPLLLRQSMAIVELFCTPAKQEIQFSRTAAINLAERVEPSPTRKEFSKLPRVIPMAFAALSDVYLNV